MCGIFGYIGGRNATPILLDGLSVLEMRGYDSAGLYVHGAGLRRSVGALEELKKLVDERFVGNVGIAHNRWATQGVANELNAHPQFCCSYKVFVVHNGKIDNWRKLRAKLEDKGHQFSSDTDTEVIAHLIEESIGDGLELEGAVAEALKQVEGTYGILVFYDGEPDRIITASMGSPIRIGVNDGEYFVSSDAAALIRYTREAIYLKDGDIAVLTKEQHRIYTLDLDVLTRPTEQVEGDIETVSKSGYPHFMLKEMNEMQRVLLDSASGRIDVEHGTAILGGLDSIRERISEVKRLIIVACGSAYYAGLYGRCLIEELAGIPVEVELASEFRYRNMVLEEGTAVLAVSQSGETADTLVAVREAKRKGLLTLGVVNRVGTVIAREVDAGIYQHAGYEKSVASTKAFISQLEIFALLGLYLGRMHSLTESEGRIIARELIALPNKVQQILDNGSRIKPIAEAFAGARGFLFLGRTYNLPIALEGALKVKEITYIPAEGYGAGEMKHGPLALIDPDGTVPAFVIAPQDATYERMVSTVGDIRTKQGTVIAVVNKGDVEVARQAHHVIEVPSTIDVLSPLLNVVPLQLFAYYLGVSRGVDVDMPRNLAKSVTVE